MKIVGVDVETTGLDYNKDKMTEISWAVYDTEDFHKPFAARSFILKCYTEIPTEIVKLTGITSEHVKSGDNLDDVLNIFSADLAKFNIGIVVAHNGAFDMSFINKAYLDLDLEVPTLELIDTKKDIPFPESITVRSLRHLAVEHGFMNPFPHSSIFDVFTMMKILSMYDFQKVLKFKREPTYIVWAKCNYDNKEKARTKGFRWQGVGELNFDKKWVKALKESALDEDTKNYDFEWEVIHKC